MLLDAIYGTSLLSGWAVIFLALPVFCSSAVNPWVYGYRNSEVRGAVRRVLDELLAWVGLGSPQYGTVCPELLTATVPADGAELNSFASHVRLCAVSPIRCTTLLLPEPTEVTAPTTEITNVLKEIDAEED